jgi:hypothetical protein
MYVINFLVTHVSMCLDNDGHASCVVIIVVIIMDVIMSRQVALSDGL